MPARKWTTEQKARQARLIRTWEPWKQATGPRTQQGKAASSKNALNYSLRELLREMTRTNRAIIAYINGTAPAPPVRRHIMDGLLDDVERAFDGLSASSRAKGTATGKATPLTVKPDKPAVVCLQSPCPAPAPS
jgi:hypothetical protein